MAKQSRIQRKLKSKHRAHKRDSVVIVAGKDGNHAERRKKTRAEAREKREAHEALMAKQVAEAQFQAALAQENAQ